MYARMRARSLAAVLPRSWGLAVTKAVTPDRYREAPTPHRNSGLSKFAITNFAPDFAAKIGVWRYAVTYYAANYAAKQRGSDFTQRGFTHCFTHRNPGSRTGGYQKSRGTCKRPRPSQENTNGGFCIGGGIKTLGNTSKRPRPSHFPASAKPESG